MAFDLNTVLQIISADERLYLELLLKQSENSAQERQRIQDIIERYIITSLEDENGFLRPGSLTDEIINDLQNDLLGVYSDENIDRLFAESITILDARLLTIDDLMKSLELENAILGSDVFEFQAIQNQQRKIAEGLVRGAYGEGDYTGSIERINNQMNEYRLNRDRDEWAKRQDLMRVLEIEAGAGISHSNSIAISAMATVDRELRRAQAFQAGIEDGLYSGPRDSKNRPFCEEWLGQVKSWEFWDNLKNDMPKGLMDEPVSIYCGGINCRHRIVPWVADWSDGQQDLSDRFAMILNKELSLSVYPMDAFMNISLH